MIILFAMPKNIVLCSDGTGNAAGKKGEGTNVWKIFRAVELRGDNPEQVAFYDDGVGTSSLKPLALAGEAFGWGLSRNIRELYSSLVHCYQPGDSIYLFGFSRGAFTVRSLGGLICLCGIVDPNKKAKWPWSWWHWSMPWRWSRRGAEWPLRARIKAAYKTYRKAHKLRRRRKSETRTRKFEKRAEKLCDEFRKKYSLVNPNGGPGCRDPRDIPIRCIGVWDTVDAVGLPVDELTDALDLVFRFKFHRHELHRCVESGYHAVSIDDQRHTFHPVMWNEGEKQSHQRIEQVWFAGVHSNVGGGYPKDQMALVALDWMMEKAEGEKLRFRGELRDEYRNEANVNGEIYDSRSGLSSYYRYRPRNIHEISDKALKNGDLPKIHPTVFDRIDKATADYAPVNLPKEAEIAGRPGKQWWQTLGLAEPQVAKWWKAIDPAWDVVWLRRVLYLLFVVLSIFFVWKGFALSSRFAETCRIGIRALDPVFDLARWAAPAALESWIGAFRMNTFWLVSFLAATVVMTWLRGRAVRGINDRGNAAWKLAYGRPVIYTPKEHWFHRLARVCRSNKVSDEVVEGWFKKKFLPVVTLVVVTVLLIAGLWWLVAPTNFKATAASVKATLGVPAAPEPPDCGEYEIAEPLAAGESRSFDFATDCACRASDVVLEKGGRYAIEVVTLTEWCDASFSATPAGLRPRPAESNCPKKGKGTSAGPDGKPIRPEDASPYDWAGLFRRAPDHPWFQLLGAIGTGYDHRFAVSEGTTIDATETGRLYLYVNDAVNYLLPGGAWYFYTWKIDDPADPENHGKTNNRGTATITVTRLQDG